MYTKPEEDDKEGGRGGGGRGEGGRGRGEEGGGLERRRRRRHGSRCSWVRWWEERDVRGGK